MPAVTTGDSRAWGCALTPKAPAGAQQPSTSPVPRGNEGQVLSSPDELDESLSGGFTHVLIVDGQDLVSWQEFILRGATCRERGSGPARHPGAAGWGGSRRVPSTSKAFVHVCGCGGHPADPPEVTGEDRSPGRGPIRGRCRCASWSPGDGPHHTPYLLPLSAPPPASRCQPRSQIRSGGGAGLSPVGVCPKAAAHIPYHRHRAPPASHGCTAEQRSRL